MNRIQIEEKTHFYASKWNELTSEQVIEFARLYLSEFNHSELKLRFLAYLLGVETKLLKRFAPDMLYLAAETLNFLFEKRGERLLLNIELTENKIPQILNYYGPKAEFEDLNFIEFINAHSNYVAFAQTWNTTYLNNLVAILYRLQTKGKREKYNDETVEERVKRIEKVSFAIRLSVFFYFEGCMNNLHETYSELFKRSGDEEEGKGNGFLGILFDISGDKFGDFDKTAEQNLHTILTYLNSNLLKHKK